MNVQSFIFIGVWILLSAGASAGGVFYPPHVIEDDIPPSLKTILPGLKSASDREVEAMNKQETNFQYPANFRLKFFQKVPGYPAKNSMAWLIGYQAYSGHAGGKDFSCDAVVLCDGRGNILFRFPERLFPGNDYKCREGFVLEIAPKKFVAVLENSDTGLSDFSFRIVTLEQEPKELFNYRHSDLKIDTGGKFALFETRAYFRDLEGDGTKEVLIDCVLHYRNDDGNKDAYTKHKRLIYKYSPAKDTFVDVTSAYLPQRIAGFFAAAQKDPAGPRLMQGWPD